MHTVSYKVLKRVVSVDQVPTLVVTVDDSDAEITGVPSGATVRLQIVASNAAFFPQDGDLRG